MVNKKSVPNGCTSWMSRMSDRSILRTFRDLSQKAAVSTTQQRSSGREVSLGKNDLVLKINKVILQYVSKANRKNVAKAT